MSENTTPKNITPKSTVAVLLLVIIGLLATVGYFAADDAHMAAQWAECNSLPVSWQMYVTAYGGLACGLVALFLTERLVRRSRSMTWVAGVSAAGAAVLLLEHGLLVYWLYQPDPGGVISCAG
ncbi:hypothetical protein ACFYXH_02420 [Streptomyces sp. NPDC002730]|uniref:hypothetical protein n=1 Tax=Streptomyces sp. NPDC002730 TaxID=3364662 RepID=UPI003698D27E